MIRKWVLSLTVTLLSIVVATAQIGDCETIVTQALNSVDDLCIGVGRNAACYGASQVLSETLIQPRPDNFFVDPGDQALLANFTMIQPQPLNLETGEFGVGLLNLQANIPNTVPGQAVLFLLVGDAQLTNEVGANSINQSAFQSFYFLPGVGASDCYEAEPTLTIQTPGSISTTLVLNGVETEFSPGTLLTITDEVCTIHRGNIIRRNSEGETLAVLLANETVEINIDEAGAINVTNKRGISEREYQRGENVQAALNAIAFGNGWDAQFLVPPPEFDLEPGMVVTTPDDGSSPPDSSSDGDSGSSSASTGDCETQHTVKSGETLHMIAQRYDTSILGVADFNGLENPRVIYPGQVLCIPDAGSGFEALPAGYK